jgi:hypothetical protein
LEFVSFIQYSTRVFFPEGGKSYGILPPTRIKTNSGTERRTPTVRNTKKCQPHINIIIVPPFLEETLEADGHISLANLVYNADNSNMRIIRNSDSFFQVAGGAVSPLLGTEQRRCDSFEVVWIHNCKAQLLEFVCMS